MQEGVTKKEEKHHDHHGGGCGFLGLDVAHAFPQRDDQGNASHDVYDRKEDHGGRKYF
jgi:hypothetical protein